MRAAAWRATAIGVALVAGATLVGCSMSSPGPAVPSAAAPTPSATTKTPRLYPTGTAAQNRAYFDMVNKQLVRKTSYPGGKAVVANLVKAGFDSADIEYTPDKTAIGLDAEAMYFSVKFGDDCLVGEIGHSFGYHSTRAPVVDGGTCLYGLTEKP